MTAPKPARTFISYATQDGAVFAAKLRLDLEFQGFSIWQDIVALQGNADWWSQIENALRSKELQHFILVVTPGALASPIVRREIRLAKQEAKSVWAVKGPGIDDMSRLPRWLGNLYDLDVAERRTNLLRVLELPSSANRVPMMAPEPPADFVARPTEYNAVHKQLLDPKGDAVAITAALRGAGGYGKTTLAKKLAHDTDIQDAYFDGVLWVELGEHGGGRVLALISDLVALITGEARTMTTIEAARTALAEALGDRRILLVIDDVWQKHHLDPFLQGGHHTTRLVTTRFDRELPDTAVRQAVDAMQASEALKLLSWGLPEDQAMPLSRALGELAQKLHDWAQLLKLANGFLRDRVSKYKLPLARAVEEAGQRLAAKGLPAFDDPKAKDYDGRHRSVAAAIGINLDLLDIDKRVRFGELGIFPEDADIPVGIVARLWAPTGEPDEFATIDLLTEFYDLSLLLGLDLDRRTIRFHDTTRHFLQHQAGKAGLVAQHKKLIQAMGDMGGTTDAPPSDTDYFYRYLPSHLADAGDRETLDAVLLDPGWLRAKLDATKSPQALVADYEQHGVGQMQNFIGRTLRLTTGICARDQRQLLPQLLGRLLACADPAARDFLERARHHISRPAVLTQRPSLTPPGAEVGRFDGHRSAINALVTLSQSVLASASEDHTIRLWDPNTGVELVRLEGHEGSVNALSMLADGRLVSCSDDRTVRIWDIANSIEVGRLEGHRGSVATLVVLPDGRLASGSFDNSIRIWDPSTGTEIFRLDGHGSAVASLVVLPDGRLASGSRDYTIRVWDVDFGQEVCRIDNHGSAAMALAVLPDGRLAAGCDSQQIRLWDLRSCAEIGRLVGHRGWVKALAVLPGINGEGWRLASASHDNSVRIWDVSSGTETARLDGHAGWINSLAVVPDIDGAGWRLASGSNDKTIRLWDIARNAETSLIEGHHGWVRALALLPDGQLASGSGDKTIRLWDTVSGNETARYEGHSGGITALAVLADGQLASASDDRTIRVWDRATGSETARLEGHLGWVMALAALPDGRLVSGSYDRTIRVWDSASGAELARLNGHEDFIAALLLLPDGRLASGGGDHTIRFWDLTNRTETARLEFEHGWVMALKILPDGRLATGSSDKTIRLWDLNTGAETARLENPASVTSLAVLPNGRLASGGNDRTIRLWNLASGLETVRLEVDAAVPSLIALPDGRLVAGDQIGRLHWLEIVD